LGGKAVGPGPRSFEALRWLERLEVAGLEPFALAQGFGQRAAYSHVARLADRGLAERIYDREGSLVAITRAGRRAVRPELPDPRPPRIGPVGAAGGAHSRTVSWMAARLTLRGLDWVSDQEARTRPDWQIPVIWARRGHHRPDLGVDNRGHRVAIEVELTAKTPTRLKAILGGYEVQVAAGRLAGVVYVTDHPGVRRGIERAAASAGLAVPQLRLWSLEDLKAETRQLGLAGRDVRPTNPGSRS
jgi:hypothetical protein